MVDLTVTRVVPTFSPMGILDVVFFDNVTMTSVNVTPGMNLTMERESAIYEVAVRDA